MNIFMYSFDETGPRGSAIQRRQTVGSVLKNNNAIKYNIKIRTFNIIN